MALEMIDLLEIQLAGIESELRKLARRQTGCRALMGLYGMGELTSLVKLTRLAQPRPPLRTCSGGIQDSGSRPSHSS